MKNKKIMLLAGVLLFSAGALASCGGGDSSTSSGSGSATGGQKIKVWCAPEDIDFVNQAATAFKAKESKYANATIDVVETNEPDVPSALSTDLDAAADVFHFAGDQLGNLQKAGQLYKIPAPFLSSITGIDQSIMDTGKVGGDQYGLPFTPNTYFMYYDANVYTPEEVKSFKAMLNKEDIGNYKQNFGIDLMNGWYTQSYFFSNGCSIFSDNKQENGISPRDNGVQVANWINEYYQDSRLAYDGKSVECGKTVAAYVSGSWDAAKIKENIEANGGTYAAAPLPAIDFTTLGGSNEQPWLSVRDNKHVGVKSTTKQAELSCKFAAYLVGKDAQLLRYNLRKTSPTNSEATAQITDWDPAAKAASEQLAHQFEQPKIYSSANFWDPIGDLGTDLKTCEPYEVADYYDTFISKITTNK